MYLQLCGRVRPAPAAPRRNEVEDNLAALQVARRVGQVRSGGL